MSADKNSRTVYGVKTLLSSHKDLRRLKRQSDSPSIHGTKLWGSSYMLMNYLQKHPLEKGCKVMELGAGWGTTGIYCAKKFKAEVTAVDADPAVFPYLRLFAEHNKVSIEERVAYFEKIKGKELGQYDVIIAADICFWDELGEAVYKLIRRALKAGVKKIIIGDPCRPPFNDMAEKCVDKFYGEVLEWETKKPKYYSGHILLIENA